MGSTMSKSGNFLDSMQTENCHVVMLGLDSAGKTTALYRLKFDQYLNTVPTIGFNCEKVQGSMGKAKGVQFLIWDVGGQEKLRPLWRSYTRCTDGILFVVDSVDIERMEEAKMELMRTAKCPDNQGVPVLILANKQDLPGACNPKDLEKLLGLYELVQHDMQITSLGKLSSISSSSTGNIMGCSKVAGSNCAKYNTDEQSITPKTTTHHSISFVSDNVQKNFSSFSSLVEKHSMDSQLRSYAKEMENLPPDASPIATTLSFAEKEVGGNNLNVDSSRSTQYKGWYIQPACAITGEGLQEGLGALYEMILKRRKLNKVHKKKAKR